MGCKCFRYVFSNVYVGGVFFVDFTVVGLYFFLWFLVGGSCFGVCDGSFRGSAGNIVFFWGSESLSFRVRIRCLGFNIGSYFFMLERV